MLAEIHNSQQTLSFKASHPRINGTFDTLDSSVCGSLLKNLHQVLYLSHLRYKS
jgi:hypothetical protein